MFMYIWDTLHKSSILSHINPQLAEGLCSRAVETLSSLDVDLVNAGCIIRTMIIIFILVQQKASYLAT